MNGKKVKEEEEEGVIRNMREAPLRVVNDVKRIARVMAEDYGWKHYRIARAMAVTYYFLMSNKATVEKPKAVSNSLDVGTDKGQYKIYLCGAITGLNPVRCRALFQIAQNKIATNWRVVMNPFDNGLEDEASWEDHMRADIKMLMECDAMYVVNDISNSKGAKIELNLARALGIKVMSYKMTDQRLMEELKVLDKLYECRREEE